jgi:hypothetical protein
MSNQTKKNIMSNRLYSGNNESNFVNALTILGGIVTFITVIVIGFFYSSFVCGFVGMKLWSWFVVPVFGLPALTWAQSYGISLVASLYTHQLFTPTNKDEREPHEKISHGIIHFIHPWLILFIGWICKNLFL